MNTKLLKKAKINFEKNFFKLMYNAIFWKTMKNVKKQRIIKFVTIERSRNYSVSKLNYYKVYHRKLITNRNEKKSDIVNEPVYLDLSILDLSKILDLRKTVMYEFPNFRMIM